MTTQKRKPFFIQGNFQLKFILYFTAVLASGILTAAILICQMAARAVEKAAFSSHLSMTSSADLVRQIIMDVNWRVGAFCVLAGLLAAVFMYFYLQKFFGTLADYLRELAGGKFSSRLMGFEVLLDRSLSEQYNAMAGQMDRNYTNIKEILDDAIVAIDRNDPVMIQRLKSLTDELEDIACP